MSQLGARYDSWYGHDESCPIRIEHTKESCTCGVLCKRLWHGKGCSCVVKCQLCSGTFKRGEVCDCSTPEGIIDRIDYKKSVVLKVHEDTGGKYIQVRDYDSGWRGRKWRLSTHMTKGEIVQTAFMACLAWEEHECREAFKYKDQPVMSSHYNIEALVRLCEQGQFEERT